MTETLLDVRGLRTVFETRAGRVPAVDGVDVIVQRGECLGVVGESGSGKSVTFASVMGLIRSPGRIEAGEIRFDGRDLRALSLAQMRAVRGKDIAMTMQDALTALNPALTVGDEVEPGGLDEVIRTDAPLEDVLRSEPLRRLGAVMAVDPQGVLRVVLTREQVRRALTGPVPSRAS